MAIPNSASTGRISANSCRKQANPSSVTLSRENLESPKTVAKTLVSSAQQNGTIRGLESLQPKWLKRDDWRVSLAIAERTGLLGAQKGAGKEFSIVKEL
ncbi:MAG: hypothetical protein AAGF98_09825 [Cyanobacteria bacterium P01_H01_bin.153]